MSGVNGPPTRRSRLTGQDQAAQTSTQTNSQTVPRAPDTARDFAAADLRARRLATFRLEPLEDGMRDPFDRLAAPRGPSSFGLTSRELRAEVARCLRSGWSGDEVRERFVDPATLEAA